MNTQFDIVRIKGVPFELHAIQRGNGLITVIPFSSMVGLTQTKTGAMITNPDGEREFVLCDPEQFHELMSARNDYIRSQEVGA